MVERLTVNQVVAGSSPASRASLNWMCGEDGCNMTNYSIILDEDILKSYIDWLPELEEHECFYGCLFARKKYCKSIPWPGTDKTQLKRFTAKKYNLLYKIRQLECPVGSYEIRGQEIPQDALALYLQINPRNLWKATIRSIGQLAKVIESNGKNANPHQEILSEIQRSSSKKKYIIFDLDEKSVDKLKECIAIVGNNCEVIETRGGYHILVIADKMRNFPNKKWYNDLQAKCDVTGDNLSPVPGCIQGGFMPIKYSMNS